MFKGKRIGIAILSYNAERTIEKTIRDIPEDIVDRVILFDDGSQDDTLRIAKRLGVEIFTHPVNRGYGVNLKRALTRMLKEGVDIIVLLHGDYQYDPTKIPQMVEPIVCNKADVCFGGRTKTATAGGMPLYKRVGNRFLAMVQNWIYRQNLYDYATGYKAFRRDVLENINYMAGLDTFGLDEQMNAQIIMKGYRITMVDVPTRYFAEASSVDFFTSVHYGFETLYSCLQFLIHKSKLAHLKLFDS